MLIISPLFLKQGVRNSFCKETTHENKQFSKTKPWISNPFMIRESIYGYCSESDKAFTGTVMNLTCLSLNGGSLEIKLKVPLKVKIAGEFKIICKLIN